MMETVISVAVAGNLFFTAMAFLMDGKANILQLKLLAAWGVHIGRKDSIQNFSRFQ